MREPISVPHTKTAFQVIFRLASGIRNWSEYVEAETAEDAITEARNLFADDSVKSPDEIGNRRAWRIVECRELLRETDEFSGEHVLRGIPDPLYPRWLAAA